MGFKRRKVIGIMGSGTQSYPELSIPLAQWIAKQNYHLLTGGGGGVMAAAAEAFCSVENRQGISIGIVPTELNQAGQYISFDDYPNPWIELTITSPLSRFNPNNKKKLSRNYICILSSDVIIALPGDKGTKNEIELALNFHKPIILFGWDNEKFDFPKSIANAYYIEEIMSFINYFVKREG